jgi:hypothetical protein
MRSRLAASAVSLLIGAAAGLGYPYLDLAVACRVAGSEACVWRKAYFPLTFWVSLVLIGGITAVLVYAALSWRRKRKGDDDAI